MPQGPRGWAVWIAAQAALTYALKLLIKLGENAVMGWGDDQIAAFLGIKSPTLATLVNWGPPAMAAAGVLIAYHFMVYNRLHPPPPRFQDRAKEIDLTEALWWVSEKSAWGRWQKAQYAACLAQVSESKRLRESSNVIWKASRDGDLVVRGRLKNSVEYNTISRDFWRSASLNTEPNNAAIWKPIAHVEGIKVPDYDNFIVERVIVEVLWPRYQWRYWWPTFVLKVKAALKGKPRPMSEPDKKQELVQAQVFDSSSVVETTLVVKQESEPTSAAETVAITPTAAAPKDWERLFAVGDDGRSIWLHFMPDTKHDRADALLLIVYGQKVLCGVSRIKIPAAHAAVDKTVSNAPNRFRTSNTIVASLAALSQLQHAVNRDWVDECVPIYLERVGLSQGGFYQLTEEGERRATMLAYDLIRRA